MGSRKLAPDAEVPADARRSSLHARPGLAGWQLAVLYAGLATLPIGGAWLSGLDSAGVATEAATGLGLVAGAMVLLQHLSSGRFEHLSGRIGIDRTKGFHLIAGIALLVLAVLHPLGYVVATALDQPSAALHRLEGMVASPRTRSGLLALGALLVIVILPFWRERLGVHYERWRASHGLLAIVAAGLVLHHALTVGSYSAERHVMLAWGLLTGLAVVATLVLYVVRPWRMWREAWHLESITVDGEDTWRMELLGPAKTQLHFAAGQFVWITLAPHRPPFHDHPFSIASAKTDLPRLRLIVRASGDCTREFCHLAPGTRVAIDGPHGSFVLTDAGENILMIAGGVGIAPLLGMLEHAAATGDRRRFRLLYAARHDRAFAGLDRLQALAQRLDLDVTFLADKPSQPAGTLAGPLSARHIADATFSSGRTEAYVCGPPAMMAMATDALLDLGLAPRAIHYERFDYLAAGGRLDRRRHRQSAVVMAALLVVIIAFALR